MVQVGDHTVRIERYLSEGGYAHVYLTTSEKPIYPPIKGEKRGRWGKRMYTEHCLKRIAFQDEAVWADVRKEIEVMVGQTSFRPPHHRLCKIWIVDRHLSFYRNLFRQIHILRNILARRTPSYPKAVMKCSF